MSGAGDSRAGRKCCTVAYATPERQLLWRVELAGGASIAEAIAAAQVQAGPEAGAEVPWESAAVGVFGELRARSAPCADGDRIELYRPLHRDPRERRRERVQRERRGRRGRAS